MATPPTEEIRTAPDIGTPAGRYAAVQAMTLAQRLLALDDLWTAFADSAVNSEDRLTVEEVGVIERLVGEIRDGLYLLDGAAYEVRTMLAASDDETVAEALDAISESSGGPFQLRSLLTSALPDYEPRSAAITACDYLRENWGAESDLLGEKLAAVQSGEAPPGDWRFPFKCAAFLMVVGAGVAATIITGGAPVAVGLAVTNGVGGGVLGWTKAGCPDVLGAIGGGRR